MQTIEILIINNLLSNLKESITIEINKMNKNYEFENDRNEDIKKIYDIFINWMSENVETIEFYNK